ncbi:MAG: pantetheine-phosphate adenylyltransferase [Pseudomonadota bacterium]
MRIGFYPGTFDPVTIGHGDIIRRALRLVDKLIIGVAINQDKGPLFDLESRVDLLVGDVNDICGADAERVGVRPFEGLLMKTAEEVEATVIVRGLRAVADFEYEYQMVGMNRALNDEIETVFLMAEAEHQAIASRLVKEIARLGGDVSKFVSPRVVNALNQKYGG